MYILFLMFLTTPPGNIKNPDWALQSTTAIEFGNKSSCDAALAAIKKSIIEVPTIQLSAGCMPKGASANYDAKITDKPLADTANQSEFKILLQQKTGAKK